MAKRIQPNVGIWPKDKLLLTPPELPMEERVHRYQHNIQAIHEAGCLVPSAMVDSVDPEEIRAWFEAGERRIAQLKRCIRYVASLPEEEAPEPDEPFLECDFDHADPVRVVPVRMISPGRMLPERWIIDVARMDNFGHPLFVAAVIDLETKEIIDTELSADPDTAMMTAFGSAVFYLGAPEVVVIDNGVAGDAVAREAAKMGAEVRRAAA